MTATNKPSVEYVYSAYHHKVLCYINSKVSPPAEAEDLCSAVFVKIQQNIHSYDPSKGALSTWVFAIARNAVTDYFRTLRRPSPLTEELAVAGDVPDNLLREESLTELAAALSTLSANERDVVILHYYHSLTLRQIAPMMGMSYSNVKLIHRKALARLKALLSL